MFRRLDGYRPPKPLVGRETRLGPVPAKLYPIFRDREELASSPDLTARIKGALDASDHLVVVCSPHAAASRWVNEEIKTFHGLGKADRVHAVLADGEPAQAFPPALTTGAAEPIAADLRKTGDGWTDGPLKVIAGILGLGFGELKDRELARARARTRIYAAIAALFALLAIFAGISAWRAVEQTRATEAQLSRAEAVILTAVQGISGLIDQVVADADRGAITIAVADGLLQTAQSLVAGIVARAPENRRLKWEEARLNGVLAEHYRRAGKLDLSLQAARRAERIFAELAASDDAVALANRSAALADIGDTLIAQGDREGALKAYEESLAMRKRLAASDPGNADWAGDVSVSLDRIGNVRVAEGDREGALKAYEESLAIHRRLAAADPGNALWARDVSVSLDNIGDVRVAEGDRAGALKAYEESLAIAKRLAAADPGNALWARDVSVSLEKAGDVRMAEGDRAGALTAYDESLAIAKRLAASDPGNAGWARDVVVSLFKIGRLYESEGETAKAAAVYSEAIDLNARLVALDPGNAQWAKDRQLLEGRLAKVKSK